MNSYSVLKAHSDFLLYLFIKSVSEVECAQTAIRNYHRLCDLNKKHLFLILLGYGRSKIKSLWACFLACGWLSSSVYSHNRGERKKPLCSLYKDTNLILEDSTLKT